MSRGIITTLHSGVVVAFEWKIDFFTLLQTDGKFYYSPDFSSGGEKWFLWIRPIGSSEYDSSGHVDLELCKCISDRSIKQTFSLSLKTVTGEKYNEQYFLKDFDNENRFHAFNRFISRSELDRRRSELVPGGVLTVVCTMRSSTSARSDKEEASNAEVNQSDVTEASGSSHAGTKESDESIRKKQK